MAVDEHKPCCRTVAEEVDFGVDNQLVAFVDIVRVVEVSASVAVDVDAYGVIDDGNLAVDAHADEISLPVNLDTHPFRRSLAYPNPPHDRDCVDAINGMGMK